MKKYVVVRVVKHGTEVPVLSNDTVQHADMVSRQIGIEPVSAGFFKTEIVDGRIVAKAFGDSSSLHLDSRPEEDGKLIADLLNGW